jgi:hypothetical protein
VLLRLAYLTVTNAFAVLRLFPMSDRDKDTEILALRHQLVVLQRQLGNEKVRFTPADRAFLAALLCRLPREALYRLRLLVRPDTILRWHRDLIARRHAARSTPKRPGLPPTVRSIRVLVLRLVRENPQWGYRRVHGELLVLGVKVAVSPVWQILQVIASPDGTIVWVSGSLPGAVHDLNAARIWGIIRALAEAGLLVLADKGYLGAGEHIKTPYKGRDKPEPQKIANRSHAKLRGPGERANAQLKTWKILTKLRCCPHRAGHLAKAIHVLQNREASA